MKLSILVQSGRYGAIDIKLDFKLKMFLILLAINVYKYDSKTEKEDERIFLEWENE
jgi:hypothetical protein